MNNVLDAFADPVIKALPKLPEALLTFAVGYIVLLIARRVLWASLKVSRIHNSLKQMLLSLGNILLWVFLAAIILYSLGLSQIAFALSGSVAVVGIILATGTTALVTDIVAGLYLAADPDFNVGFKIKSGDVEGEIEKIDLRKVRIRDKDGKIHVLPSSMFDKAQWIVLDDGKK